MPSNDYFTFLDEEAAQAAWDALIEARRKHWNVRDEDIPTAYRDGMDVYKENLIARSRRELESESEELPPDPIDEVERKYANLLRGRSNAIEEQRQPTRKGKT